MRPLRLSFWALVLPPLLVAGPVCAQTAATASGGWQTATPASAAPAPPIPRPVPVEVTPLASPAQGWSAAPASRPADTGPPALRSAPLTETAPPAPLQPAPVTMAAPAPATPPMATAPALRSAPLNETVAPAPQPVPSPVVAPPPMIAAPAAPVMRAPVGKTYGQRLAFADGVSAQFDVTYQTLRGFRPLTLDLYQPRPRDYALPLVVFVHGGGDTRQAGTIEDFPSALAALAARGYVIASVNYRLSGEARFPAALQDVKAAIRWLRARSSEYNIDSTRIAVWGVSGGAQIAALAGVACGVPLFAPEGEASNTPPDCVQAVVSWSGITDLKTQADAELLGCPPAACAPGLARIASPLSYISVTSPPFLLVHGAADARVPVAQAQKFHDALRAKNVPVELVIIPEVGHALDRAGAADPAVNRQALEKVAAFLARTFPPGPIGQKVAGPRGRGPVY